MRIHIEASPPGPLRVISDIPASTLVMLEGLNGIGKTLAIRILQLCTGEMPYRTDSASWRSLCEGLGVFTVVATGLIDASEVRWEANSRDWAEGTPPEGPVAFRRILVDGAPATMDDVQALLRVHRLAGDEDIVQTLAQRVEASADAIRRWSRRYADAEAGPLASLEQRLGVISELLGEWSSHRYEGVRQAVESAEVAALAAAADSEDLRLRRDALQDTRRTQHQLHQLETDLPSLQAEVAAVDEEIEALRSDRDQTHNAITALVGQVAGAAPIAHELSNARRTLGRNRDKLAAALDALAVAVSQVEVEPSAQAIDAALIGVEDELSALVAQQTALDQAPAMRELLDASTEILAGAEHEGLGGQILIDDPETDVQLTVTETMAGMSSRRVQLEGQPPRPETQDIVNRIGAATRRQELLRAAAARVTEVGRFRRLVDQSQERVDAAVSSFDPGAVERLQELEARRRLSDERMLTLAAHRAALRQQLGNISIADSPAVAASKLATALETLGIAERELHDELMLAEESLEASTGTLREAEATVRTARRDQARADAEIRRISSSIATAPELNWLREALPQHAVPHPSDLPSQQAAAIGVANDVIDLVIERLGAHRGQLGAVEGALRGLVRRLRGQALETRRYVEPLEKWLGAHFSEWFNSPRVRTELLPEAEGPVEVDLHNAEVKWTEGGLDRARPLEAFSSGEQAFAYTRARLAILDEEEHRPANRLIVLDEFGAFIAHDRLAGLLAHLQDRAVDHPYDQVIVVLPLSRDYASMAAVALGAEAERLQGLADQIADHGYALQELAS